MDTKRTTGMPSGVRTPRAIKRVKLDLFFARLAETCNVALSCREAGLGLSLLYKVRRRDPAFATRWEEAVEDGYRRIEGELMQRALGDAGPGDADGDGQASAVDGTARSNPGPAPFDQELAFRLMTLWQRADPQRRRSGARLKQPDPAEAFAALERKLTSMEKKREKKQ